MSSDEDEVSGVDASFGTTTELIAEARRRLPQAAWDYLCGGSETETTLKRNRQALDSIAFRPRVLRAVADTNATTSFLGVEQRLPVLLAPLGAMSQFDPQGAVPAARAASEFGCFYMLSSAELGEQDVESVAKAAGEHFLLQLYAQGDQRWIESLTRQAVDAGCKGLCLTVDTAQLGRRERSLLNRHSIPGRPHGQPRGGDEYRLLTDWDFVDRLRSKLDVPLILKGIATAEDAALAVEHGVEVIYVSNHGGRQLDHGRGAIELLAEILSASRGRAEIIVDGGFVRGTDVLKALAMGARMVGLGRLQALALAASGQDGVRRMLEILETEIQIDMRLLGVNQLQELDGSYLHPVSPVGPAGVLSAFPLIE